MVAEPPTGRKARAEATRRTILDAARALFEEQGYAGTTIPAIAQRAGVAVQTVYYVFHTKARLLREMFTFIAAGAGEAIDTERRDWVREAAEAPDARTSLTVAAEAGAQIYRRFAPLFPTVLAAMSTEPEIAEAWDDMLAAKRRALRVQMQHLDDLGRLRPGLDPQTAADVSFAIHSIETYRLFTEECGWTHERFRDWMAAALCDLLLDDRFGP